MIIEWMLYAGQTLFDLIFMILGILPDLPSSVVSAIDELFNFMFSGVSLVSIFIDIGMVKTLVPYVIAIINFDNIAKIVMFVLKKIPMLAIR